MNKKPLIFLPLLFNLFGCEEKEDTQLYIASNNVSSLIYLNNGDIKIIDGQYAQSFNTSITLNLYHSKNQYTEGEINDIFSTASYYFRYYHALSDRHYKYSEVKDNKDVLINNVKVINESYGSGNKIKVDKFLYDLLKSSYEFTQNSNGKFNMFIGSLNSIYESKLNDLFDEEKTILDQAFMISSNLVFSEFSDSEKTEILNVTNSLPKENDDFKDILTFYDETSEVKFNKYKNDNGKNLEISLGGNAKGFATQAICDKLNEKYPDISLMLNSGFSSIKAIGSKVDGNDWRIRYNNPIYYEASGYKENIYNQSEIYVMNKGGFNISTSGYYNQYFYEYDNGNFLRRNHILDPKTGYSNDFFDQVSIYLDDTGLADMYTTALMNCSSLDEAVTLFNLLNSKYEDKTSNAGLILCYKVDDDLNHFKYSLNDFKNLSSYSLPKLNMKDNTIYEGDYSDLKDTSNIKSVASSFEPKFKEMYKISSNIFDKANILDSTQVQKPNNIIAILDKIED